MFSHIRELSFNEVRNLQLEILKEVAAFCELNNIKYFLCAGTMLGAVRHKGFIPWDDDVDIMIPRPDYDQLLKIFTSDRLRLVNHLTAKSYNYPYAKICYNNTIAVSTEKEEREIGIFIDVFPVDGYPADENKKSRHYRKIRLTQNALTMRNFKFRKDSSLIKELILYATKLMSKFISKRWLIKKLDEFGRLYDFNTSSSAGIAVWGYGLKEICPKEVFEKQIDVEFEGYTFKGHKEYDLYLSSLYGNYMVLPPEEERKVHNYIYYIKD